MTDRCRCCGEEGARFPDPKGRGGVVCRGCALELTTGYLPPLEAITSRRANVPAGVSIRSRGRRPGAGEGNDYFGNHT